MKDMTGKEIAEMLGNYVNNMSLDPSDFIEAALDSHRTLQQSLMRLIMQLIQAWAELEETGRYDLRNEATVKLAKQIISQIMPLAEGLPFYLPFV